MARGAKRTIMLANLLIRPVTMSRRPAIVAA